MALIGIFTVMVNLIHCDCLHYDSCSYTNDNFNCGFEPASSSACSVNTDGICMHTGAAALCASYPNTVAGCDETICYLKDGVCSALEPYDVCCAYINVPAVCAIYIEQGKCVAGANAGDPCNCSDATGKCNFYTLDPCFANGVSTCTTNTGCIVVNGICVRDLCPMFSAENCVGQGLTFKRGCSVVDGHCVCTDSRCVSGGSGLCSPNCQLNDVCTTDEDCAGALVCTDSNCTSGESGPCSPNCELDGACTTKDDCKGDLVCTNSKCASASGTVVLWVHSMLIIFLFAFLI